MLSTSPFTLNQQNALFGAVSFCYAATRESIWFFYSQWHFLHKVFNKTSRLAFDPEQRKGFPYIYLFEKGISCRAMQIKPLTMVLNYETIPRQRLHPVLECHN